MSLSLAIVFPAVLTMVLLVVQASLWWYARQVALTAAREGAEAGRASGVEPASGAALGAARARDFLDRADGIVTDPRVSLAGTTGTEIRITVTVRAQSLLPGISGHLITQHITAPRERFVPPGGDR